MSKLRDKIESILISEVDKIYEKAAMGALTVEDIRKLEVLVKIKDVEGISGGDERKDSSNKKVKDASELMRQLTDGEYKRDE